MKEAQGNLFIMEAQAVCITTNGFVKSNGQPVMGRGCAKEYAQLFPETLIDFGEKLKHVGNNIHHLTNDGDKDFYSFPVKPVNKMLINPNDVVNHMRNKFKPGDTVPGWACIADMYIITCSAYELVDIADLHDYENILIPRPGCGAGELNWSDVKPVLDRILDDRFTAVTF